VFVFPRSHFIATYYTLYFVVVVGAVSFPTSAILAISSAETNRYRKRKGLFADRLSTFTYARVMTDALVLLSLKHCNIACSYHLKVKLILCLTNHHAMMTYGGLEI